MIYRAVIKRKVPPEVIALDDEQAREMIEKFLKPKDLARWKAGGMPVTLVRNENPLTVASDQGA